MQASLKVLPWPAERRTNEQPPPRLQPGAIADRDRALVDWFRLVARGMRICARIDLDRACALIAAQNDVAADRYANALLRAVFDNAKTPVAMYQLGAASQTHFEAWLVRLIRSFQTGDDASARMLIGSFVERGGHRKVSFLAASLAAVVDQMVGDEP